MITRRAQTVFCMLCMLATIWPAAGLAAELPAGKPVQRDGMQVMAVYLQPVRMEPQMAGQDPARTDIHLEADIHALANNKNGFAQDAWIPYLRVHYTLAKDGSDWRAQGLLDPMVAADGPHYGANVKLDGPGAYELVLHIEPPSVNGFMRHTDKETGVAAWWAPFDYRGHFAFVGTGKKGAY
ncbi:MAG TPA: iron transporter [Stellaceae bacterium]|nr:iron transporter [Stellaceae bacterium]